TRSSRTCTEMCSERTQSSSPIQTTTQLKKDGKTTMRSHRYEIRNASGATCCKSDELSALCDSCRQRASSNRNDQSHARKAEAVPAARGLADVSRNNLHSKRRMAGSAEQPRTLNHHGVPVARSLGDIFGGAR